MRVYLGSPAVDGIARVTEALRRGLPNHGIIVTDDPADADLLALHGADRIPRDDLPLIAHTHGLMWADYQWRHQSLADEINRRVIDAMIRADAITAPSRWVRQAITRGLLRRPEVIYHGVDTEAWQPRTDGHGGYVLWNKARADEVSDPRLLDQVAAAAPNVRFITTIGRDALNVRVIGPRPHAAMHPVIQGAALYLATTRETFGIGTLEALACGVPIVGYAYGGQEEIVIPGETGYLVPPGDVQALAEAIQQALAERDRLSVNARADALSRWQWADKVAQYAALYRRVVSKEQRPTVSVIVTCYNLAKYLTDCLDSVIVDQGFGDVECIIVDDCSTDTTARIGRDWEQGNAVVRREYKQSQVVRYLRTPHNLGLSGARNYGAAHATGKYLLFLDADDMLAPGSLARLVQALDSDPGLHIAYGAMELMNDDGSARGPGGAWPVAFDWPSQMAHLNQLTYCALMRREVWEETGGYRTRHWRAEDAAFWCRATSFGFRAAKVTDAPVLVYRLRAESKSQEERRRYADNDGPWTADYPWATAHTGAEGLEKKRAGQIQPPRGLVPFGAPHGGKPWRVPHQQHPAVSVIIPCGPGHERYLIDALDSLVAQDMPAWEAIVINDTGTTLDEIPGAPYARIIDTTPGGTPLGPAAARNLGLECARAPLALFLDADDWLTPGALTALLERYTEGDAGYIYSDWLAVEGREETPHTSDDPTPDRVFEGLHHPVTVLMATAHARELQFDPDLRGWEDWDFFLRAQTQGICGARVPLPLLAYRLDTGTMRQQSQAEAKTITTEMKRRYSAYATGAEPMGNCCGGNSAALLAAKEALQMTTEWNEDGRPNDVAAGMVLVEYIGTQDAPVTYQANGRQYRMGRHPLHRYKEAPAEDAAVLAAIGSGSGPLFRIVEQAQQAEAEIAIATKKRGKA